ncbi:hypothetical protein OIO90_000847 [Microbotryomycetes sp. JL221]|nr:hypothetical protein OIO90_000847 [Microbotryomycetes sp. JL221]
MEQPHVPTGTHYSTVRAPPNSLLFGWPELNIVSSDLRHRPESPELYPTHRLDKATTGTLLFAKTRPQAKALSKAFGQHQIERHYLAVVVGQIKPGFSDVITAWLQVDEDRTGRKHQLRLHCAEVLQASVVGDFKYGYEAQQSVSKYLPSGTMLLHAHRLAFYTWAKDGKRQSIEVVAPLPRVFSRFLTETGLQL